MKLLNNIPLKTFFSKLDYYTSDNPYEVRNVEPEEMLFKPSKEKKVYYISKNTFSIINKIKLSKDNLKEFSTMSKLNVFSHIICFEHITDSFFTVFKNHKRLGFTFNDHTTVSGGWVNDKYDKDIYFNCLDTKAKILDLCEEDFKNLTGENTSLSYYDADFTEDEIINIDNTTILLIKTLVYLFLADMDINIVQANSKHGKTKKDKVVNNSNHSLHIVSNKWNKMTIISGPIPVSGHFRLQPFGTNRSKCRLIFINPHNRNKYTKKNRDRLHLKMY